ncbi:putative membrane protein YdjX (TVP38/TMEM64 family) [Clostridium algifaecis]|uniref:TVP38/TMEM64 family membrane protein n=1 Tax=Clostridium algifaecis TaxID=1472040 RepID=A0ABS4KQY4_9CLOT|nr:TVP38/TMEM64 family protein [Clostridium algifaecis]MBP2032434.1 putative membrane protein YdjX (TVP38/TMEM64 family) [Clostridium algifaecis]
MKNNVKYDKSEIIRYILLIVFIMFIVFVMLKFGKRLHHIKIHKVIRYIKSYGKFSAFIFVIIYTFKPVLFIIPSSIMSIIAGNIYGPYIATILSMIGCFGSATVAFFLARFLGRSFVDKILRGKALKLNNNIEKYGFKVMTIMRLSFVFPFDPLSYAAGLSKMKYRDFILGTTIGIFPEMLTYSFMGKNIEHPFSIKFILPIIFLIIVVIVAAALKKRIKNIQ